MISHWFTIGCYNVGGVTHRNSLQGLWPHGRRGSTAEVLNLLRLADLASNFEAIWTAPFRQPLDQLDSLFSWDKAREVGKKKLEFPAARFGSCVFFSGIWMALTVQVEICLCYQKTTFWITCLEVYGHILSKCNIHYWPRCWKWHCSKLCRPNRGIWYESTAEKVIPYMVYGKELICINTYWCV